MGLREIAAQQQRSRSAAASAAPRVSSSYDPIDDLRAGVWPGQAVFTASQVMPDDVLAAWAENTIAQNHEPMSPAVFQQFGVHCHLRGWSVFPEEASGDRKPAHLRWEMRSAFRGKTSQNWLQVKPSKQRDSLPDFITLFAYTEHSINHNVAGTSGAASAHVRAIDIDCLDEGLAEQIVAAAREVLGETPFVRVGRAPKVMLFYRAANAKSVPTKAFSFALEDGSSDPDNKLEILGHGRNFTLYGFHHKTKRPFDWSRGTLHPAIAGPQEAPLIDNDAVDAFLVRVREIRKMWIHPNAGSSPFGGESSFAHFTKSAGDVSYWIPTLSASKGGWSVDADGHVVDGREAYLRDAAWATAGANIAKVYTPSGLAAEGLLEAFLTHVDEHVATDGKRDSRKIRDDARDRLNSALTKFQNSLEDYNRTGKFTDGCIPRNVLDDGRAPQAQHLPAADRPADLSWLPPPADIGIAREKHKKIIIASKTAEQLAADRADRALITDVAELTSEHNRVADEIATAGRAFLSEMAAYDGSSLPPLHILAAPTGSGKTTAVAVAALGEFCKANPRQLDQGPVIVCFPTHANVDEALSTAQRNGMIVPAGEYDEAAVVASLRANGVKVATIKGKILAGCQRADEVQALRNAGIGASNLCGARVDEDTELVAMAKRREGEKVRKVEVLCPFRERGECGYWNQMREAETADIVFVPHSYLTMDKVPAVIKNARAVIIDETITYRVLHQTRMRVDVLGRPRPAPQPTKAELAEFGGSADDIADMMLANRDAVVKTVTDALFSGVCPANAIRDAGQSALVADAIKVVTRAHVDEWKINPTMSRAAVLDVASKRVADGNLIAEEKFWRIVADRVEMLDAGTAKGDREHRLQLVEMTDPTDGLVYAIRMSWRSEPNWAEAPMLLLDASAAPEITEKVFGRKPTAITIEAPARMRTIAVIDRPFANRAFMPPADATDDEQKKASELTADARSLIDKVSSIYSHSRVLVASTSAVRQHLMKSPDWRPNPNVDEAHFGAMRGRDYAKFHAAALTFGRSEQPIHIVDGYAAALTYDDENPELPYDVYGSGLADAGRTKPLFRIGAERVIRMRTGHDVSHWVPEIPRSWGRIIENQWREEELRQNAGRLRPVYRGVDDVPVWICVTKSLPADVIVDEVITLEDLVADRDIWKIVKAAGDIWSPRLVRDLPATKAVAGDDGWAGLEKRFARNPGLARMMAAQNVVRVVDADTVVHSAFAMGWVRDPVGTVGRLFPTSATVMKAPAAVKFDDRAMTKKPDWMDQEFSEMQSEIEVTSMMQPHAASVVSGYVPPSRQRARMRGWLERHDGVEYCYRADGTLETATGMDWMRTYGPDGVTVEGECEVYLIENW